MKTYNRVMEYFWLFMATTSAALGLYLGFTEGWTDYRYLFYFSGMAMLLYFMRFMYRRRQQQDEQVGE